jgi:hypothetical protein
MIIEEIKTIRSGKKELRQFGVVIGCALAAIAVLLFFKGNKSYLYNCIGSALFFILAVFVPKILTPLQKIWMAVAVILGWFMSHLILALLFYCVMTPIGCIMKLLNKELLALKFRDDSSSFWISKKETVEDRTRCEKQY